MCDAGSVFDVVEWPGVVEWERQPEGVEVAARVLQRRAGPERREGPARACVNISSWDLRVVYISLGPMLSYRGEVERG